MYGMIHRAARDMVVTRLGQDEWEALAAAESLTDEHFIGIECYPDAETRRLVEAIAARLGLGTERVLHELGRHWIGFAGASPYGRALRMAGDDLESFLQNLDRMHASIKSNMPQAQMPSFEVVDADPRAIRIVYRSQRRGLEPFVRGILVALAERFGERVTIASRAAEDGVLFEIRRAGDG